VVLYNPLRTAITPVLVTPVGGSGNTQFNLTFPDQTIRGDYQLTVGPSVADAAGHFMNQNGNSANGEAADSYTGVMTFAPAAAQTGPGPILFEETFENWPPVPPHWSFQSTPYGGGGLSSWSPRRGANCLALGANGGDTSAGSHSGMAVLAVDLSRQIGQTNLFLEFWISGWVLAVEVSNDAQSWQQILSVAGGPNGYIQYRVELTKLGH